MKLTILISILLLCIGCSKLKNEPHIYVGKHIVDKDAAATFTINCARAANPMSDEEGEDLVAECFSKAEILYGVPYYYTLNKTKYSTCTSDDYDKTASCVHSIFIKENQ